MRLAREELQRQKTLFEQGLVSRQTLDQASAAVDTATASLKALQAREQESRVELQYLPRDRARRRRCRRYPRSRRGPRHHVHRHHDDQRQRRSGGVYLRADRAGAGAEARNARAAGECRRRSAGADAHRFHLTAGGRQDSGCARQGAGPVEPGFPDASSSPAR